MKYVQKTVEVEAHRIVAVSYPYMEVSTVGPFKFSHWRNRLTLDNGDTVSPINGGVITADDSRRVAAVGDYCVIHPRVSFCIIAAEVFEREYEPAILERTEPPAKQTGDGLSI